MPTVAQTWLDIPRPLFTQSWTTGGKIRVLLHKSVSNHRPVSPQLNTPTTRSITDPPPKSEDQLYPGSSTRNISLLRGSTGKTSPAHNTNYQPTNQPANQPTTNHHTSPFSPRCTLSPDSLLESPCHVQWSPVLTKELGWAERKHRYLWTFLIGMQLVQSATRGLSP